MNMGRTTKTSTAKAGKGGEDVNPRMNKVMKILMIVVAVIIIFIIIFAIGRAAGDFPDVGFRDYGGRVREPGQSAECGRHDRGGGKGGPE